MMELTEKEWLRQIDNDPNATERERKLAEIIRHLLDELWRTPRD